MLSEEKQDELFRNYQLAKSSEYKEIRQKMLDFIVDCGNSTIQPERIQGMLMLIKYVDSWVDDYEIALKNRKEN
jgi:hypothetical protein